MMQLPTLLLGADGIGWLVVWFGSWLASFWYSSLPSDPSPPAARAHTHAVLCKRLACLHRGRYRPRRASEQAGLLETCTAGTRVGYHRGHQETDLQPKKPTKVRAVLCSGLKQKCHPMSGCLEEKRQVSLKGTEGKARRRRVCSSSSWLQQGMKMFQTD